MVTVKIENTYSDGHESVSEAVLPGPAPAESLTDWFEDKVFPYTGDAEHDTDGLGSCYTATIIATDNPGHLGVWHEWND